MQPWFSCSFAKANTVWSIEPENSTIPPSSSIEVTVKVNVNDCVHFTDKLTISIANGNQIEIDFSVTGVGTTIVSEPSLYPEPSSGIDFGPIFSTQKFSQKIKLTNKGRRHQQLIWSIANFDKKAQQAIKECQRYKKLIESKDIRFKNLAPPAEPPRNVFSISPSTIEIKPNEEIVIDLEGYFISIKIIHI